MTNAATTSSNGTRGGCTGAEYGRAAAREREVAGGVKDGGRVGGTISNPAPTVANRGKAALQLPPYRSYP